MTYEDAVAKMAAADVGEDAEVSTILQDHLPLMPTRSDASFHSLQYSHYTSEGEFLVVAERREGRGEERRGGKGGSEGREGKERRDEGGETLIDQKIYSVVQNCNVCTCM